MPRPASLRTSEHQAASVMGASGNCTGGQHGGQCPDRRGAICVNCLINERWNIPDAHPAPCPLLRQCPHPQRTAWQGEGGRVPECVPGTRNLHGGNGRLPAKPPFVPMLYSSMEAIQMAKAKINVVMLFKCQLFRTRGQPHRRKRGGRRRQTSQLPCVLLSSPPTQVQNRPIFPLFLCLRKLVLFFKLFMCL